MTSKDLVYHIASACLLKEAFNVSPPSSPSSMSGTPDRKAVSLQQKSQGSTDPQQQFKAPPLPPMQVPQVPKVPQVVAAAPFKYGPGGSTTKDGSNPSPSFHPPKGLGV